MMGKKEIQVAIKKLAFEMTASMSTANFCMDEMDLDSEDDLWDIARYLEKLVDEDSE